MRFIYITGIIFSLISPVVAQTAEVGLMAGVSVYSGDLSPRLINTKFIEPSVGVFYRHNFNPYWAAKGSFFYAMVSASDAESSDPYQVNRNLSFKSNVLEFALTGEFNFFGYINGDKKSPFSPYLFGGIALINFNPQAQFKGDWVDLHPLGTEGQRLAESSTKEYSLSQIALPIGFGIKWSIADKFTLGIEAGARKTFTDYLDDVSGAYADKVKINAEFGNLAAEMSNRSINKALEEGRQRGNSNNTDWYSLAGITLSYNIGKTTKVSCNPFKAK